MNIWVRVLVLICCALMTSAFSCSTLGTDASPELQAYEVNEAAITAINTATATLKVLQESGVTLSPEQAKAMRVTVQSLASLQDSMNGLIAECETEGGLPDCSKQTLIQESIQAVADLAATLVRLTMEVKSSG